ncbi:MAG: hypothetical protein HDS66_04740 [Bacteroidales bacterium]|nr:hypothetical protein [Bacteroidales bacterium]
MSSTPPPVPNNPYSQKPGAKPVSPQPYSSGETQLIQSAGKAHSNRGSIIWLVAGGIVLVAGICLAIYLLTNNEDASKAADYARAEEVLIEQGKEAGVERHVEPSSAAPAQDMVGWVDGSNTLSGEYSADGRKVGFTISVTYQASTSRLQNAVISVADDGASMRLDTATISTDGTVLYLSGASALGNVHIEAVYSNDSKAFEGDMDLNGTKGECSLKLTRE